MNALQVVGVLCAALTTTGCMSFAKNVTAKDAGLLIDKLHAAGCGGSVDIDLRGGTGQLGGQVGAQFTVRGQCPVGDVPPPLTEFGQEAPSDP